MHIFIEEMRSLFVGQGFELLWTHELHCPTVTEYLQMIDGSEFNPRWRSATRASMSLIPAETGGLFRLLARLLLAESIHEDQAEFDQLSRLLCRLFQIRDDYQNLMSEEVSSAYD